MRSGRPALDRLALRAPFLLDWGLRFTTGLSPNSKLRRRFIKRGFALGWGAVNREDFEVAFLFYEEDAQVTFAGTVAVGLTGDYSGKDGWTEFMIDMKENFDAPTYEVRRVKDGGSRMVAELGMTATGKLSGAAVEMKANVIYHLSPRGKIARQEIFWDQGSWGPALERAGLAT